MSSFYGIWKFITVYRKVLHWCLSCTRQILWTSSYLFFLRSACILLCHRKWTHLESGFLTTEYFNNFYVHIYYSPMEDASSIYSILLFLSSCLTKSTHYKISQYAFFSIKFCCLPLGSKNSTWHSVFKHPHTLFMHLTVRFPIPHS